jgi:glycosyltransferase involved in cell wall biosynthesis
VIAVVLPTLDTPEALARVLGELPVDVAAFVVDDGSAAPLAADARLSRFIARATWIRHPHNRGYGAAQKSGFAAAMAAGAERIVLLHGDGQYDTAATLALAAALDEADLALGSRFLADPRAIPGWRRWGNRLLTGVANAALGSSFSELHTGARALRADLLRTIDPAGLDDDFVFDQQLIVRSLRRGFRITERPVAVRYDATTRSISARRSLVYAAGCLHELALGPR